MPAKILVVDDEPDTANLLSLTLTRAGYEVKQANNGKTALTLALQDPPDLVILDVMMPEVSGLDVLSALQKPPYTSPPVILFTARGRFDDVNGGIEAGAFRYLVKPTSREKLLETVKAALTEANKN